jgi:hypothetical protein
MILGRLGEQQLRRTLAITVAGLVAPAVVRFVQARR